MGALISKGQQNRRIDVPVVFGVELKDAQEEIFVVLVCDGLPMGLAFKRAGFTSKQASAPSNLFNLPRVQERARAILEARRTTGVVTLPEVTSMLQRVFASAHSAEEYSAAHNAAFSLARLYGHVNDKSTLEIIRRPSRDPDAPSEQMLEDWAASLPLVGESTAEEGSKGPRQGPPAALLGPGPSRFSAENQLDLFNDINGLPGPDGWSQTGNGAPVGPVTGAPNERGGSSVLGGGAGSPPLEKSGSPLTVEGTSIPSFDELFG